MTFDLKVERPDGTGGIELHDIEGVESYLALPNGDARIEVDGETETIPLAKVVSIN